jgi:plastocyanin
MDRKHRIFGAGLVALAAGLLLTLEPAQAAREGGCNGGCCGSPKGRARGRTESYSAGERARGSETARGSAVQRATVVVDGGYSPESITVEAGRPVELTFIRKEKRGCGDVVQFPTLGLKRALEPGRKTLVTFTPKKAGPVPFTCSMEMYEGQVVVR